jgi:hypothetical protein
MAFDYVNDSATMDLDQCLMENHARHRSPIIHLPEIFMYQYSCEDVMECANNFKSCSMDNSTDPVVNTVNYYTKKYENKIAPDALNAICELIYENAYAIFHIGKDGTTYMTSMNSEEPTVCIDSVCLNWNQLPDNAYDMQVMWKTGNKMLSYDLFAKQLFDKFHDEDYVMNRGLKNILSSNPERLECFNKMPSFTYAAEDADEDYDLLANELESRKHYKISEFTFSPAQEAPIDDALDDLDTMSGKPPQGNANRPPENMDNTADGRQVEDIAQATNDQMEADGSRTSEDMANEEEPEDAPDTEGEDEGEGEEDPEGNPEDEELDPAEDPEDEEDTEDEKLLNDPETKEVYRKRFIALYKHINDIIDTLERFTPAYNVNCTADYYNVQNSAHRLKSAIYKICTEKMKDMQTVDVMKAYLTANYAYDSIGVMLKDFFHKYHIERKKAKI